jgi:hypothetical protein
VVSGAFADGDVDGLAGGCQHQHGAVEAAVHRRAQRAHRGGLARAGRRGQRLHQPGRARNVFHGALLIGRQLRGVLVGDA